MTIGAFTALAGLLLGLYLFGYLPWRWERLAPFQVRRHRRQIESADQVLAKLAAFDESEGPVLPRVLGYLRKVHWSVFEEVVMTALGAQGYQIQRNRKKVGDGGIDGRLRIGRKSFLVQAKRYKGSIRTGQVSGFIKVIEQNGAHGGVFVHTGSTPDAVWPLVREQGRVTIISGQILVALVRGQPIRINGV